MRNIQNKLIILFLTILYASISFINFGKLNLNDAAWTGRSKNDKIVVIFTKPVNLSKISLDYGLVSGKYHITYTDVNGNTETITDNNMANFPPHYEWATLLLPPNSMVTSLTIQVDEPIIELRQLSFYDTTGNYLNNLIINSNTDQIETFKLITQIPPNNLDNTWYSGAIFDEIYYVSSAYQYLNNLTPYVDVHPPLGMLLIAIGLLLFGISPFAWRLIPNIFGILLIPLMYKFSKLLFNNNKTAIITAVLVMTEFMHFTISRLAFLESILTLFIVCEYYFLYKYILSRQNGESFKKSQRHLYLTGIFLGLAMATKLNALFSIPAILFWLVYYELIKYKTNTKNILLTAIKLMVIFVIIPFSIYILSYIPYAISQHASNLFSFVLNRFNHMYEYQTGLINATHPYASPWWSWPLLKTPMSIYYWQDSIGKVSRSIALIGNPAIFWIFIPAFIILLIKSLFRPNVITSFILVAILAQYIPYALVHRISFIYYFYPVTPFIILAISYLLNYLIEKKNKLFLMIVYLYVLVNILLFALYFPVLSGLPIARNFTVNYLWIFKTWNF